MATFTSPCQRGILNKNDAAPMPILIQSTYQMDFAPPKITIKNLVKKEIEEALPIDSLPAASGKRLLPMNFQDFYSNCVTASIGEKLELKITDDTPDWKKEQRAAAARKWIQ